jgi:F-box/leucine-rich repeat protein 2/20
MINFTPNITDEKIEFIKSELSKDGKKGLNIIRNINKMTDPTDDGLRMPIPLASMKIKKPKKSKK